MNKQQHIASARAQFEAIQKGIDSIISDLHAVSTLTRSDEQQVVDNAASHLTAFKNGVQKLSDSLLPIEQDGLETPGFEEPDQSPYQSGIRAAGPAIKGPGSVVKAISMNSGVGVASPKDATATVREVAVEGLEVQAAENSKAPRMQRSVEGKPVQVTEGKYQKVNKNPLVEPGDNNIAG